MTQAFVYRWTELSTGKWYIGSRTSRGCHPEDGYICSSRRVRPLIIANPDNWRRVILAQGNPGDMRRLETELLKNSNASRNPMSYNLHNGDGNFTTAGKRQSQETIAKRVAKNTGQTRTEETRQRMSESSWNKGISIPRTLESRLKQSATMKGRPSPKKGIPLSEEHRARVSAANKGKKRAPFSEETRQRMRESSRSRWDRVKASKET